MTEEHWLSCSDPRAMIEWLRQQGRLSDRKARLFAVACCRRVWGQLNDARARIAVEVAERFADGDATTNEITVAGHGAWQARSRLDHFNAIDAAWACCRNGEELLDAAEAAAHEASWMIVPDGQLSNPAASWAYQEEKKEQATIIRDLWSPFHAVSVASSWRTEAVVTLARHIYKERTFDAMPALGAALSDADCTDAGILRHCGHGPHVKGCFLLDAILGRS